MALQCYARPPRVGLLLPLGLLALSCAEPFEEQDYALEAPRFVSIHGSHGDDLGPGSPLWASALYYRGSLFPVEHDVRLTWILPRDGAVDTLAALSDLSPEGLAAAPEIWVLGEGPDLDTQLPEDLALAEGAPLALGVAASWRAQDPGQGQVNALAYWPLLVGAARPSPATLGALTIARVPDLDLPSPPATIPASRLEAEAREAYPIQPSGPVAQPGQALRLGFEASGGPGTLTWRAVNGLGTALPLSGDRLDFLPASLTPSEEGDDALTVGPLSLGIRSLLATTGGPGGGEARLVDLLFSEGPSGEPGGPPEGFTHPVLLNSGDRLLWGNATSATAQATLLAEEEVQLTSVTFTTFASSPGGLGLVVSPGELGPEADPYGTLSLGCPFLPDGSAPDFAPAPFTFDDLAYGRCAIVDLLGETVVMPLRVLPVPGEAAP